MWDPWRKPLALAQFFVVVFTITSSMATMTTATVDEDSGGAVATWLGDGRSGRGGVQASPQTTMSSILKVLGDHTIPLLVAPSSLSSSQSKSSSLSSKEDREDPDDDEHQRSASSSGKELKVLEQSSSEDYVISRGTGPLLSSSSERADVWIHQDQQQQQQQRSDIETWRSNEQSSSSASADGNELKSDSINLSWSVLNNASAAIGHQHATVPDSASSGPTKVKINRSNNSINSKDDSASSKVIESIRRRSSSNRDNGAAFGNSKDDDDDGSAVRDEREAIESALNADKWGEESGASTSRRSDIHDVRNNRTTSSSTSGAEAVSSIALVKGDSILTPAALVMAGPDGGGGFEDGDTVENIRGGGDSQATNRNTISGDSGRNRTEVRRPNNGTTTTNAKLIAVTRSPHHNGKTFVHNNITRAARATTISTFPADDVDGQDSTVTPPPTQHRQSAVLVGGAGARNKTPSTHNSIRTLNHISDRKPYFGKHHHNNDKYGPHFEDIKTVGNVTNMTVQMGQSVYLNCRISLLQDKTVSWMRRLVGEKELQLLTVGNQTYSGDSRYAVHYQYPHNWRLKITKPQVTDEGTYACQISTHPPRIIQYNLHINAPQVMIIDEAGLPLQDKYYEVDSTIQLSCIVRDVKMATSVVYWNHSDQILNYDVTRGGISVKTDLMANGANSTILVARVNKSDSGNYSCSISPDQFYTVTVHVLNGESYAELHHGNGTTLYWCWPRSLLWAYGMLLILLHTLINAHEWNFNRRR